jgi:hypothetical protein
MRYTDDLTYRLIAYMRDRHHIELSTSQAEGFLNGLASMYGWAGGSAAGASAPRSAATDLIFVPLNNHKKKS